MSAQSGSPATGTAAYEPAVVGQGFRFDAAGQALQATMTATPSSMTLEAWISTTPVGTTQSVFSRWHRTERELRSFALLIAPHGPAIVFQTDDPSSRFPVVLNASAPGLADGGFHHIAATDDGGTLSVYVDGTLTASVPAAAMAPNGAAASPLHLGSGPHGGFRV